MVRGWALVVSRVLAAAALASFLLLPQVGCEGMTGNGLRLVASSDDWEFTQVMGLILVLGCVAAVFAPNRRVLSASGTVSALSMILLVYRVRYALSATLFGQCEIMYGAPLTAVLLLGVIAFPWLSKGPRPPPEPSG